MNAFIPAFSAAELSFGSALAERPRIGITCPSVRNCLVSSMPDVPGIKQSINTKEIRDPSVASTFIALAALSAPIEEMPMRFNCNSVKRRFTALSSTIKMRFVTCEPTIVSSVTFLVGLRLVQSPHLAKSKHQHNCQDPRQVQSRSFEPNCIRIETYPTALSKADPIVISPCKATTLQLAAILLPKIQTQLLCASRTARHHTPVRPSVHIWPVHPWYTRFLCVSTSYGALQTQFLERLPTIRHA